MWSDSSKRYLRKDRMRDCCLENIRIIQGNWNITLDENLQKRKIQFVLLNEQFKN